MTDPTTGPARSRGRFRRWLSRVWNALRNRDDLPALTTPAPVRDVRLRVNHTETVSFPTPARGDAYDFTVEIDLCLCAIGEREEQELRDMIRNRLPDLIAELKAAARPVARRHPPYRPADAEQELGPAIREAAERTLAGVPGEGVELVGAPRVRVSPAPEIVQMRREHVGEQIAIEAEHERSALIAAHLGELRKVWCRFINDGLADWRTPYGIDLAQHPEKATAIVYRMREDRKAEAQGLVETVAQVAAGHERLDLLDFVVAGDTALRRAYELFDIKLPDPDNGSVFDENGTSP